MFRVDYHLCRFFQYRENGKKLNAVIYKSILIQNTQQSKMTAWIENK